MGDDLGELDRLEELVKQQEKLGEEATLESVEEELKQPPPEQAPPKEAEEAPGAPPEAEAPTEAAEEAPPVEEKVEKKEYGLEELLKFRDYVLSLPFPLRYAIIKGIKEEKFSEKLLKKLIDASLEGVPAATIRHILCDELSEAAFAQLLPQQLLPAGERFLYDIGYYKLQERLKVTLPTFDQLVGGVLALALFATSGYLFVYRPIRNNMLINAAIKAIRKGNPNYMDIIQNTIKKTGRKLNVYLIFFNELLKTERTEEAYALLKSIPRPQDPRAKLAEARFWLKMGETSKARNILKTIKQDPYKFEAMLLLGDSYVADEEFDKALELYKKAKKENPKDAEIAMRFIRLYTLMDNPEGIYNSFKELLSIPTKKKPDDRTLATAAVTLIKDKKLDQARRMIDYGYTSYPDSPFIKWAYAEYFLSAGDPVKAREFIEEARKGLPQFEPLWITKGKIHLKRSLKFLSGKQKIKEINEAIRSFKRAMDLSPEDWKPYFYMGQVLYYYYNTTKGALEYYEKALERGGNIEELLFNLGVCRAENNLLDGAIDIWEQLMEKTVPTPSLFFNHATVSLMLGKENEDIEKELLTCIEKAKSRWLKSKAYNNLAYALRKKASEARLLTLLYHAMEEASFENRLNPEAYSNIQMVLAGKGVSSLCTELERKLYSYSPEI